jgi:hypothetical protein
MYWLGAKNYNLYFDEPMNSLSSENKAATTEAYAATQYLLRRNVPPTLYYKLRTFSRQYPSLFLPFSRWRWNRWRKKYISDENAAEPAAPQPIMPDTEIVIEGFPRTANTFAHIAFKVAQDRPVKMAHHTHAAAQVIAGVRKRVPTIVLIRNPEAAVISYIIGDFDPGISMSQVLYDYLAFYKPLLKYKDRFVLAPFNEIIHNYGEIIRKVNQKYGTNFSEFIHSDVNVENCFKLIDQGYTQAFGDLKEEVVSRPSKERAKQKDVLKGEFDSAALSELRTQAISVYHELMEWHSS